MKFSINTVQKNSLFKNYTARRIDGDPFGLTDLWFIQGPRKVRHNNVAL